MIAARTDEVNQVAAIKSLWSCAKCGLTKTATAHQNRQTYCSKSCMAEAYKTRLIGVNNPHYSAAGKKNCTQCGEGYKSYIKNRKFCSSICYNLSRPKKLIEKQISLKLVKQPIVLKPRLFLSFEVSCIQCGTNFLKYPSTKQMYCSYKCHLDSGGAFRAGIAASKAIMKYGAKKDANHNQIFTELRKHCAVYDFSAMGHGLPDGIAWIKESWHLFDVKNPKTGYGRRGLNPVQIKWVNQWKGGPVYLIYTEEEAVQFGIGNFSGIKRIESGGNFA